MSSLRLLPGGRELPHNAPTRALCVAAFQAAWARQVGFAISMNAAAITGMLLQLPVESRALFATGNSDLDVVVRSYLRRIEEEESRVVAG